MEFLLFLHSLRFDNEMIVWILQEEIISMGAEPILLQRPSLARAKISEVTAKLPILENPGRPQSRQRNRSSPKRLRSPEQVLGRKKMGMHRSIPVQGRNLCRPAFVCKHHRKDKFKEDSSYPEVVTSAQQRSSMF